MKKIIVLSQKELFEICSKIFECNAKNYVDTEEVEGEKIFTDYIMLSPSEEQFNKTLLKVADELDLDELDILTMEEKHIMVDYSSLPPIIEKKYNLQLTGWYDIDCCEALEKESELVFFELR